MDLDPARRRALERNLWGCVAFNTVVFTPVFVPVVVLFWQANGLDMFDVFVLQSLFAAAVVVFEVPTGMVADRLGKRTSLLWGAVTFVVGVAVYSMGHGFWEFLLAEVLVAIGAALYSGADGALLYDTLQALGRTEHYTRWAGRMRAAQLTSFAISNVVGGLLAEHVSLRATMVASLFGPVLAVFVALTLVEAARPSPTENVRSAVDAYRCLFVGSVRFVARHRLVRWYILFGAVLAGSSMWLFWLYQPYLTLTGLPLWSFGLVFAFYNGYAALASALTHRVERVLGPRGTLVVLGLLQVAPLPAMAWVVGPASFLFVLGHQTTRAWSRPIVSERVLAYTWPDKRATVLSLSSVGGRLFFALTAPLMGYAAEHLPLQDTLLVQAGVIALALGALGVAWAWIPAKYHVVKRPPAP